MMMVVFFLLKHSVKSKISASAESQCCIWILNAFLPWFDCYHQNHDKLLCYHPPHSYCVHAADITEFSWCHSSVPVVNSCYYTLHCQHNISWGLHDLKQAKNTNKLVIKTKGANKLLIISSIWILPLTFTYYSRQQIISFQFSVPFTADELIKFPLARTFDSKNWIGTNFSLYRNQTFEKCNSSKYWQENYTNE